METRLNQDKQDIVLRTAAQVGLKGKRTVSIIYSSYLADPRARRAAEAMVKEGMRVEVICLKDMPDQPGHEIFNGVDITRIQLKRPGGGKLLYVRRYGLFILRAGAILVRRSLKRRFHLVHVHNMPDVLVFSALAPKLSGRKSFSIYMTRCPD
jgi:hypothetical protein